MLGTFQILCLAVPCPARFDQQVTLGGLTAHMGDIIYHVRWVVDSFLKQVLGGQAALTPSPRVKAVRSRSSGG